MPTIKATGRGLGELSEDRDIRRGMRTAKRGERGQALLEFALTAPLLLLMLLGLIEFGHALNSDPR